MTAGDPQPNLDTLILLANQRGYARAIIDIKNFILLQLSNGNINERFANDFLEYLLTCEYKEPTKI